MIRFKHTLSSVALAVMIAVGLAGCEKEQIATDDTIRTPMAVRIIDEGYNALNAADTRAADTRASENGYRTTFTAGDKVGLYAVKGGTLVATNVCLTLTDVSGGTQWQPPTGVKLPIDADRYFAYYPYQASPGNVAIAATTAEAFFSDIISAWTPATDQSGTNYTQQDLMVGSGTLGSTSEADAYPLNVTLTHQMGLAVIKLPAGATNVTFNDFTPYEGVSGEYRYLLKPDTETTLNGSFINDGEYRIYTIQANVTGGNYRIYNVDK